MVVLQVLSYAYEDDLKTISYYTFNASAEDDQKTLKCVAFNPVLLSRATDNITLNVVCKYLEADGRKSLPGLPPQILVKPKFSTKHRFRLFKFRTFAGSFASL